MSYRAKNEARGESASGRIKAIARSAPQSRHSRNNQSEEGSQSWAYPKRNLSSRIANAGRSEKEALAEAISRSLADSLAPPSSSASSTESEDGSQYSADLAEAKDKSLRDDSDAVDIFDHTSAAPHAALIPLHNDLRAAAQMLRFHIKDEEKVLPAKVLRKVQEWQDAIFDVTHDLEMAEEKRIQDIQECIDLDMEIERQYQNVQGTDQMWKNNMAARDKQWEAKLDFQMRLYEAKLVRQKRTTKPAADEEQDCGESMPTAALRPTSLSGRATYEEDLAEIRASRLTAINQLKKKHAKEVILLKQKLERMCAENETLRKRLEEMNGSKEHPATTEELQKTETAQTDLQPLPKPLADAQAELKLEEQAPKKKPVRFHCLTQSSSPDSGLDSPGSPNKRKMSRGEENSIDGESFLPKKSRGELLHGEETF